MAGISNSPFRRLARELGSSVVVSELVSSNGLHYNSGKTMDLLRYHPSERPVGLQIFGESEANLVEATRVIEKLGADFVDLNLGCPVPKVVKKGGGAAMCRDPIGLGFILAKMVQAVKIPVTIKIRTGWDEGTRNALEVVKAATDAGVAWVAIHGRTRAQGYAGHADWDFIGEIKARAKIPIIGNGDVLSPEIAVQRYRETGVDAVMIGRGALRNPFIFQQARDLLLLGKKPVEPVPDDYVRLIDRQRTFLSEVYDPPHAMLHVRKFLSWYSTGFPGSHEFRKTVFSSKSPEELWSAARRFFELTAGRRDNRQLGEAFLMGGHG